jgi:small subunit ribosomal protein S20
MPNTKSAKKRLRQSLERRTRNRAVKSTLKTQIKKVLATVGAGDATASETEYRTATKRLDQAAAKGVIHRNKASRLKSRLAARLKAAKQA